MRFREPFRGEESEEAQQLGKAKMIVVALRCCFFFAVIMAYSSGVWNLINGYFGREFQAYLAKYPHPPSIPPAVAHPGKIAALATTTTAATTIDAAIKAAPATCGGDYRMMQDEEHKEVLFCPRGEGEESVEIKNDVVESARGGGGEGGVDDDDGDLTRALDHNPIDETWWSDYWRNNPKENGSVEPYGEWSTDKYCTARTRWGEAQEQEQEQEEEEEVGGGFRESSCE